MKIVINISGHIRVKPVMPYHFQSVFLSKSCQTLSPLLNTIHLTQPLLVLQNL